MSERDEDLHPRPGGCRLSQKRLISKREKESGSLRDLSRTESVFFLFAKSEEPRVRDDDMVKECKVKNLEGLLQLLRFSDIRFGRQGISRGMIMKQDYASGIFLQCNLHDLPGVNHTQVQRSRADKVTADREIPLGEEQRPDLFMVKSPEYREKHISCLS